MRGMVGANTLGVAPCVALVGVCRDADSVPADDTDAPLCDHAV